MRNGTVAGRVEETFVYLEANFDQYNLNGAEAGLKVAGAWQDYSGSGVTVAVIDDGFEAGHAELAHAYDSGADRDFLDDDNDASASASNTHGTAVASLIFGARDNNGMDGVAENANLIGLRIGFGSEFSSAATSAALTYGWQNADVINNSWGASTHFSDNPLHASFISARSAVFEAAVANGRDGLGTVIVNSAGNYKEDDDNTNYHGQKNAVEVVVVGSVDSLGDASDYSSPGASVLVSAGATLATVADLSGAAGAFGGDYKMGSGTSYAAPQIAGVVALMLEANPELGYRDVQEILALAARKTGTRNNFEDNAAGTYNGGGMHFSDEVGFGVVNATAAVRLAETWEKTQTADNLITTNIENNTSHVLSSTGRYTTTVTTAKTVDHVEKVEVYLNISHGKTNELTVKLTSPSGTEAVLIARPDNGTNGAGGLVFETTANTFWGESDAGEWSLEIRDHAGTTSGTLHDWSLTILGDADTADTLHVYTDEFVSGWKAARQELEDTDGGTDTVNMSAVTEDIDFDMNSGASGAIGAKTLKVASGTQVERVYLGSGDDEVQGNQVDNMIDGGRGQDTIDGGAGDDMIIGGRGSDTLSGGDGADVFAVRDLREAGDTVSDFSFSDGDSISVDVLCEALGIEPLGGHITLEDRPGGSAVVYTPDTGPAVELAFLSGISHAVGIEAVLGLGDPLVPVDPVDPDPDPADPDPVDPTPDPDLPFDPWDFTGNTVYKYGDPDFATRLRHGIDDDSGNAALDLSDMTKGVRITLGSGKIIRIIKAQLDISQGSVFYKVALGSGNDSFKADEASNIILAGDGNDRVDGLEGDDYVEGGAGKDRIGGDEGNDTLFGGSGNDRLAGDDGEDWLSGGDGDDRMDGGDGNDTLLGGVGDDAISSDDGEDLIEGGAGDDKVDGDNGNDTVSGGMGDDSVYGGKGDDVLYGNDGDDLVAGEDGDDTITGGAGADTLEGGKGDDIIYVGDGADEVEGGKGADRFVFVDANSGMGILDYDASEGDVLDVSGLLTGAAAGLDPISAGLFYCTAAIGGAQVLLDTNGADEGGVVELGFIKGINPGDPGALGDADNHGDTYHDYTNGVISTMGRGRFSLSDQSGNDEIDFSDCQDNVTFDLDRGGKIGRTSIKLEKGSSIETIRSGSGDDRLTASDQNSFLDGGAGDDALRGGRADDVLIGGGGDDQLSGGSGADTFVFVGQDVGNGFDTVRDFRENQNDRIDVTGIMEAFGLNGDPVVEGYFHFTEDRKGGVLMFDESAAGGGVELALFRGVSGDEISGDWFV